MAPLAQGKGFLFRREIVSLFTHHQRENKRTAKAYLIAHIRVHDKEKFADFKAVAGPVIAQYGGRVLAQGPNADHDEGDLRGVVMRIECDNMDAAKTCYESDEYTAAKGISEMAAETDRWLIDGI